MELTAAFGSFVVVCIAVFVGKWFGYKSKNSSVSSEVFGFKVFGFLFVFVGFMSMFLLVAAILLTFYEGQFGILTACAKSIFKLGLFSAIFPLAIAWVVVYRISLLCDRMIAREVKFRP